jgi:hypothetical protein
MNILYYNRRLILDPVAARFEAWVCGLSPAQIVSSNPTGDRSQWPRGLRLGSQPPTFVVCGICHVWSFYCTFFQFYSNARKAVRETLSCTVLFGVTVTPKVEQKSMDEKKRRKPERSETFLVYKLL